MVIQALKCSSYAAPPTLFVSVTITREFRLPIETSKRLPSDHKAYRHIKPVYAMQRYISKELTHFVGRNLRESTMDKEQREVEQYKILHKIIKEKCISRYPRSSRPLEKGLKYNPARGYNVHTRNRFSNNSRYVPNMVCFCDIPIGDLSIHISKYSPFGLSFKKSFLIERGANPILYIEKNSAISYRRKEMGSKDSTRSEYFDEFVSVYEKYCQMPLIQLCESNPPKTQCTDIGRFLFDLLCYVKFFDSSKSDDDEENYYMEREWRTPYDIHFEINDIYRIILPKDFCERFRKNVSEYTGQITFSDDYE